MPTLQSSPVQKLIDQARSYPVEIRTFIAESIMQTPDASVDPKIEAAWMEEAERRWQEYLDGKIEPVDGEAFLEEVRKKFKK